MTSSGCERTAYSIKEIRAKETLVQLMKRAGLSVSIDGVGNIFGRTQGRGPALMMGSHIDSVPGGGRFDGVAGVASALEVPSLSWSRRYLSCILWRSAASRQKSQADSGSVRWEAP